VSGLISEGLEGGGAPVAVKYSEGQHDYREGLVQKVTQKVFSLKDNLLRHGHGHGEEQMFEFERAKTEPFEMQGLREEVLEAEAVVAAHKP